jgi:uncharacterized phiE125 gp8 family phage protein
MLTLKTPPAGEPIGLSNVKAALRVETDADDEILFRMAATARAMIERRLDLAFLAQEWTLTLTEAPASPVTLRPGKVARVTGGTVRYGEGEAGAFGPEEVHLRRSVPAAACFAFPRTEGGAPLTELTLTFEAGWPEPDAVPAELIHALLLLTAHYYEERELFARGRYVALPAGLQAHLDAFREVRL